MKKSNQNNPDFEMINLDETAGWNQLEIEEALARNTYTEESMVFQGEITISEEELYGIGQVESMGIAEEVDSLGSVEELMAYAQSATAVEYETSEEEYYEAEEYEDDTYAEPSKEQLAFEQFLDETPAVAKKKAAKKSSGKSSSSKTGAVNSSSKKSGSAKSSVSKDGKAVKSSGSKNGSAKKGSSKGKKKQSESLWDKAVAAFHEMTVLDGVIAATGVIVLAVAVVTVSVFSSAKTAEAQVEAFASLGEDMSYLSDAGKGTLLAMADSDRWLEAMEETEEETLDFEYEEKDLEESKTVNVNMKLTSVQKDLKIKFVNYKTGKLISNIPFEVSITDSAKVTKNYKDDDKDGVIYLKDMAPGKASVTMMVLSGEEGYAFNTAPQTIKIKDQIEYTKIDVAEEVKSESEVNAAVEDTAQQDTAVEAELKDTVEWVASSKKEVDSETTYEKVEKKNIPNPADSAKAFVRMTVSTDPSVVDEDESSTPESSTPESSTPESSTPESSTPESSTPESSTPENSTLESSTPESSTPESSTPEPSSKESPEDKAKKDTVSLLKDKSGEQMYLLNSKGNYVEAKYADYYSDKVTFYKKVKTSKYKYTGWQEIDGKTYFFTKDHEKVKGEQVIQGAKYTFDSDGVLKSGSGTLGIDVSKWNGNIDWNAVKNSGVSYVIIRCGYRGSSTGAMIEDPKFKTNIQGALNAGLKVGIYFFSQAVNEVEAVEEASMTIGLIKKYSITYPVFLDVESSGGRGDHIDKNTRTKVIKAFCETMKNSGYKTGVYANKTWLNSYINAGELSSYKIWLAQYNSAPTYAGKFDMWQYSSKGQVAGISGYTDMNLSYMGY